MCDFKRRTSLLGPPGPYPWGTGVRVPASEDPPDGVCREWEAACAQAPGAALRRGGERLCAGTQAGTGAAAADGPPLLICVLTI